MTAYRRPPDPAVGRGTSHGRMSPGRTGFGRPRAGATDSGFCRWLARGPPGGFGRRGVLRCHPGGFGHRKGHRDEAGRRNRLPRNRPAEPSGVPRAGGSGGRGREPATRCAGGRWRSGASGHGRRRFGAAGQPGYLAESLPLQVRRKRGTTGKPRFALGDGSPVGSQDWLRGHAAATTARKCTGGRWQGRGVAGGVARRRWTLVVGGLARRLPEYPSCKGSPGDRRTPASRRCGALRRAVAKEAGCPASEGREAREPTGQGAPASWLARGTESPGSQDWRDGRR
jgi:hypothetical protein